MVSPAQSLPLQVHPDVEAAITSGRPVVALESSLISHGFACEEALRIAHEQEQILKRHGVQPATTGIIKGQLKVGLSHEDIELLAAGGEQVRKASVRDISLLLSLGQSGGTTVATSIWLAHRAGIAIMSTGGIGGVHRQGERTLDISADLQQLSRTPVAIICAGAKSILDIPKTLEYLETLGVPVLGYQTEFMPAFYSEQSSLSVDYPVSDAAQAAGVIRQQQLAKLDQGVLVCNPIPRAFDIPESELTPVVESALSEAERQGISGKDVTPFLLGYLHQQQGHRLLEANKEILRNNARVAAEIAREYYS